MSNHPDIIFEIIEDLQRLQIRQNALLGRLAIETTAATETSLPRARAVESESIRFSLGETVSIRNPGRLQPSTGTVVKIGSKRITVQARNGALIPRAPHNLIQEQSESSRFRLGENVIIRNPGISQPSTGIVVKIGSKRITVQAVDGSLIPRAPHNLIQRSFKNK
jgi:hypothetical protein